MASQPQQEEASSVPQAQKQCRPALLDDPPGGPPPLNHLHHNQSLLLLAWGAFLKSIASFSGDLSSLTAPPFILSPVSLSEFPSYWGESYEQFAAIADGANETERQLRVTEWFVATLAGQFTRREKETGSEKKPLNPFLGEQFFGSWNYGDTVLSVEQVSHHPPVTAYLMENKSKGLSFEGNCAQKTSFSGRTIVVKQVGHGLLRLKLASGETETYLITLPKLVIEGLWFGAPYIELSDHSYIQGSHGLTTTIDYKGKGYFSGKSHTFTALIGTGPNPKVPLYAIEGQWTGISSFTKATTADLTLAGKTFLNAAVERPKIQVKPIEEQGEYESRRVWKDVADGIRRGDFEAASVAKSALEISERNKRKEEQAEGRKFETRLFESKADDEEYAKLAGLCKHKPDTEDSWVYQPKA